MSDNSKTTTLNTMPKLPSSWRWVKLGEVCEVIMGQSPPSSTYTTEGKGLPFFQGKTDFGDFYPTVRAWCTNPIKVAEEGDILISVRAPVGPINMNNLKCCIGRGLATIRCQDDIINWFIFWYLRSIESEVASLGSGSTFGAIKREDIVNLEIPLAPKNDQHRIAAKIQELMQEIKQAKESCEKQLEASQSLPSAYLRQVFESEEAKKWERRRFQECITKRKEQKIKGIPQKNYKKEGKYPIVDQGQNLICGYTDNKENVYEGDLPVIIFGDHTRLFKYVDFPFAIGADGTKIISHNKDMIIPKFLYFALLSLDIKNLGYSRHYKLLRETDIPIPDFTTQQELVKKLEERMPEAKNLKFKILNQQSTIDALPQAILHKAFRGEL